MSLGWTELVLLLVIGGVSGIVPLWGAIDAALKPDSAWQAADQSKLVWVALQGAGVFLSCIGLVPAIIYFMVIRPRVVAGR